LRKKILSLCLALLLLLALPMGASAAGTTLTIDAPGSLPAVGQTFTVKVSISGNPGLCAAQFTLAFNSAVVDCTGMKLGTVLSGSLSATNPDAAGGAIVAAASASAKTGDGVLAEYTFKVLKSGDPAFQLTDGVFSDGSGKTISTNVETPEQQPSGDGKDQGGKQDADTDSGKTDSGKTDSGKQDAAGTEKADGKKTEEATTEEPAAEKTFSDVPASFWGYSYIQKAAARKLITGNPDGTFRPNDNMTRAEFVMILYRMAGSPEVTVSAKFKDVSASAWYAKAVCWAAEKGYVTGDGTNFDPSGLITRQQVVAILYRYNGGGGMEALLAGYGIDNLAAFTDKGKIASWAEDAMRWAIYEGIITGTSATTLSPTGTAQRAQVAAFFVRYLE